MPNNLIYLINKKKYKKYPEIFRNIFCIDNLRISIPLTHQTDRALPTVSIYGQLLGIEIEIEFQGRQQCQWNS